jgi:hypothetical protein
VFQEGRPPASMARRPSASRLRRNFQHLTAPGRRRPLPDPAMQWPAFRRKAEFNKCSPLRSDVLENGFHVRSPGLNLVYESTFTTLRCFFQEEQTGILAGCVIGLFRFRGCQLHQCRRPRAALDSQPILRELYGGQIVAGRRGDLRLGRSSSGQPELV